MFTLFCYLFALIPVIAGLVLWYYDKRVILWEVALLFVLSFGGAAIFNWLAVKGLTDDIETWSGQVSYARYVPEWEEYYEYAVYRTEHYTTTETDSKGKTKTVHHTRQVFDHWEPSRRHHNSNWDEQDSFANIDISQSMYHDIQMKFGGKVEPKAGRRHTSDHNSRMISGDPNDYYTVNTTGYVYPVIALRTFENKVKATPSLFSFKKVSPKVPVFEYPPNGGHFSSDRLLGTANNVPLLKWDQLNAILGPMKKVNLIAVGFGGGDISLGTDQEAKWVGGRKNDLVITFGGPAEKPNWVYVFGWTEEDLVKRSLESYILENGFKESSLDEIQNIVIKYYKIKDWSKFNYLSIDIPFSRYIWLVAIILVITGGWVVWSLKNDIDKI